MPMFSAVKYIAKTEFLNPPGIQYQHTVEHMHKKFEINRTKIKGPCQSGSKLVSHNSKHDLPLIMQKITQQG